MGATLAKGLIFCVLVPYFKLMIGIALLGVGALYVSSVAIGTTVGWLKSGLQKLWPSYAPASVT